jgi:hypothetical protein
MTSGRVKIHTHFIAVFVWCALLYFATRELIVWNRIQRVRMRPEMRLMIFLFRKWATPNSVRYSLVFAFVAALLLELFARQILHPLVLRWHAPRTDESDGVFHLAASERVIRSSPARRASRRTWAAGTLVLTNQRLWFFPRAHDAEIWSRPLSAVRGVRLEPAPRIARGLIVGWPDRLALQASGEPRDGDGAEGHELFAIADPQAVLAWFDQSQRALARPPSSEPLSANP